MAFPALRVSKAGFRPPRFALRLLLPLIATHASLRLRVNLLSTQNRILIAIAKKKKPVPLGPALFIFGSGGPIVELYAGHDRAVSIGRLMSAFTKSGRSDHRNLSEIRVRFRPAERVSMRSS
jgi:hypothetical protein